MAAEGFERAKASLSELVSWWSAQPTENRNEATTRVHLINDLLLGALAWPKSQITAEDRFDGEYTDYSAGSTSTQMIVEAKREGIYFELPAGAASGAMRLTTLTDASAQIAAAVEQVLLYCQKRGVPLAVVCNGHQIIAFLASRQDGTPPMEGRALVFDSPQSMYDDFQLLWDNLSPPGVDRLMLQRTLGDTAIETPPEKLSARIPGYPGYWARNKISTELKTLGDLVLQDLIMASELEHEFLARCYLTSNALSEYALVSKEILEARYSMLETLEAEVTTTGVREHDAISSDLKVDVTAGSFARRPLILLGDVGVGKSIFIRHFIQIDAREVMERSIALSIDFGGEPALAADLNEYVMDRFVLQLRANYGIDVEDDKFVRNVYEHELRSFATGCTGDFASRINRSTRRRRSVYSSGSSRSATSISKQASGRLRAYNAGK